MDVQTLQQYWALVVAASLLAVVAVIVLVSLRRQSSGGKLYDQACEHKLARQQLRKAQRSERAANRKLGRLEKKADRIRPRDLERARGMAADAAQLVKIAGDREQVEANKLRKIIYEEFPPARHEALRRKFLPGDIADARPFSF